MPESSAPVRFGLFMSQANKRWPHIRDEFRMAEDLGFDHAWVVDHLVDTDGPPVNTQMVSMGHAVAYMTDRE